MLMPLPFCDFVHATTPVFIVYRTWITIYFDFGLSKGGPAFVFIYIPTATTSGPKTMALSASLKYKQQYYTTVPYCTRIILHCTKLYYDSMIRYRQYSTSTAAPYNVQYGSREYWMFLRYESSLCDIGVYSTAAYCTVQYCCIIARRTVAYYYKVCSLHCNCSLKY